MNPILPASNQRRQILSNPSSTSIDSKVANLISKSSNPPKALEAPTQHISTTNLSLFASICIAIKKIIDYLLSLIFGNSKNEPEFSKEVSEIDLEWDYSDGGSRRHLNFLQNLFHSKEKWTSDDLTVLSSKTRLSDEQLQQINEEPEVDEQGNPLDLEWDDELDNG